MPDNTKPFQPKLTHEERAEIHQLWNNPGPEGRPTYQDLADRYKVSANAIWYVVHPNHKDKAKAKQKEQKIAKRKKKRTLKIPVEKWPEINRQIEEGIDPKVIAAEYEVSASLINRIDLDYRNSLADLPDDSTAAADETPEGEEPHEAVELVAISALKQETKEEIVQMYQTTDMSYSEIGEAYNVSKIGIWTVINDELGPAALLSRRVREEVLKDDLLRTIQKIVERIQKNVRSIKPGSLAIPLGILLDKYQLISGRATSRHGSEFADDPAGTSSSAREKITSIIKEAVVVIREHRADSSDEGEGESKRVPPLLLQGSGDGKASEATVVSSEVAEGDGSSEAPVDHSAEKPREDNSGGSPSDLGAGQEPKPENKDSVPVGREGSGEALRDSATLRTEPIRSEGIPESNRS